MAVAHPVEAGQIGAGLGRRDDVVGGDAPFHTGQANLLAHPAQAADDVDSGVEDVAHARLAGVTDELTDDPEAQTLQVGTRGYADRLAQTRAGGIPVIASGDDVEQSGRVLGVARERPDLVQGTGKGDEAVAAHCPVRGLQAHHAAQRCRLTDGAARVGAQSPRRLRGGDAGGGAATGAARHPVEVPGVACGLKGRVLRGAAHGELVHVQLAQEDKAGLSELGDDGGVVRWDVTLQNAGGAGGLHAAHAEDVLQPDGHPFPSPPSFAGLGIYRRGCGQGSLLVYQEVRLHGAVHDSDAAQVGLRELRRGDFSLGEQFPAAVGRQPNYVDAHGAYPIRGTTNCPLSTSGPLARASSRSRPRSGTSGTQHVLEGDGMGGGSTPERSNSASCCTLMIRESSGCSRASSSSLEVQTR